MSSESAPLPLRARAAPAPLSGRLRVPGDKSISHRALMFGALAIGTTEIQGLLEGEDVLRTAAAMRLLGATVDRLGPGAWRVAGRGIGGLTEPADVLDMGNSGTAARLICGLLAGHPIFAVMTGDASLRRRPMKRVTDPLAATGARFLTREGGRLPLAIEGARNPLPLDYTLPVASAQVKSACLLAGLCAPGVTRVVEPEATRDHSENMLRHFGATVRVTAEGHGRVIELDGQPELRAAPVMVPGDPSSAAFFAVAALIVPGSRLVVENVGLNPLRTGLFETLRDMGASLTVANARTEGGEPVGDLVLRQGELRAVDVPAGRAPSMIDEYPILAVAAAHARGVSRFRGLCQAIIDGYMEGAVAVPGWKAAGVQVEVRAATRTVHGTGGPAPGGGVVATQMDHRLAMSALVLGLASRAPMTIDDGGFIATSFPDFVGLMNRAAGGTAIEAA